MTERIVLTIKNTNNLSNVMKAFVALKWGCFIKEINKNIITGK